MSNSVFLYVYKDTEMEGHMDASMQADIETHIEALRKAADERTSFAQSLLNEATIFNDQAAMLETMIVDNTSVNIIMNSLKSFVNIIGNEDLNANMTWRSNRSAAYEALMTARKAHTHLPLTGLRPSGEHGCALCVSSAVSKNFSKCVYCTC